MKFSEINSFFINRRKSIICYLVLLFPFLASAQINITGISIGTEWVLNEQELSRITDNDPATFIYDNNNNTLTGSLNTADIGQWDSIVRFKITPQEGNFDYSPRKVEVTVLILDENNNWIEWDNSTETIWLEEEKNGNNNTCFYFNKFIFGSKTSNELKLKIKVLETGRSSFTGISIGDINVEKFPRNYDAMTSSISSQSTDCVFVDNFTFRDYSAAGSFQDASLRGKPVMTSQGNGSRYNLIDGNPSTILSMDNGHNTRC